MRQVFTSEVDKSSHPVDVDERFQVLRLLQSESNVIALWIWSGRWQWWWGRWTWRQANRRPQGAISQNPTRPSPPADLSGYSQFDKESCHCGVFIDKIHIRPCIPRQRWFSRGYLHQHGFLLSSPPRSTNKNTKTFDHRSNNTKQTTHRSLYWGLLCPLPVSSDQDWGSRLEFGTIYRSSDGYVLSQQCGT